MSVLGSSNLHYYQWLIKIKVLAWVTHYKTKIVFCTFFIHFLKSLAFIHLRRSLKLVGDKATLVV